MAIKKFVPSAPDAARAPGSTGRGLTINFKKEPEAKGTILRAKLAEGRYGMQTRLALDIGGRTRVAFLPAGYEGLNEHVGKPVTVKRVVTGDDVEGRNVEWDVTLG